MPDAKEQNKHDLNAYRRQALALLSSQNTLVLAVAADGAPWVAPVYYVYDTPGLCFFSSPEARHIQALAINRQAAGAVYKTGDDWKDIQGLQMDGTINEVLGKLQILKATTSYLAKFPFARELMTTRAGKIKDLGQKVRLYAFVPREIHCTDNRLGFGQRIRITL